MSTSAPVTWQEQLDAMMDPNSPLTSIIIYFTNDYVYKYWMTFLTDYWP